MKGRKTWEMLQGLSKQEQAYFLRWLWAEWEEQQQYVQHLARWLIEQGGEPPTMLQAWQALYTDQPYDDARLRKLLRDLGENLRVFLSLQAFREDAAMQAYYELIALEARHLPDVFIKEMRKQERRKAPRVTASTEDWYLHFRRKSLQENFALKYGKPKGTWSEPHELLLAFDRWWIIERLYLRLNEAFRRYTPGPEQRLLDNDQLLRVIQARNPRLSLPLIDLYEEVLLVLEGKVRFTAEKRQAFVRRLQRANTDLSPNDASHLIPTLISFFNREINLRKPGPARTEAVHTTLELTLLAITEGYLLVEEVLNWRTLRSVVNLALSIPDPEQAETLLEELLEFVAPEEREAARLFNLANVRFFQMRYAEVLPLLVQHSFRHPIYEVAARGTLMACHYELQIEDESWQLKQIDRHLRYVQGRTQVLPITLSHPTINLLRFLRRMIKARNPSQLEKLQEEMAQTRFLSRRQWMLQKIAQRMKQV